MTNRSHGPKKQQRARRLLEALLDYADGNLEVNPRLKRELKVTKRKNGLELLVVGTLKLLAELTQSDKSPLERIKREVEEAIATLEELLPGFQHESRQGSRQRRLTIPLWHTNKEENLKLFDEECRSRNPEKSQCDTKTPMPYENIGRRGVNPEQFIGRLEKLKTLHELLQQNSQVAITAAIIGMGGVGKTELTIQYARKYLHTYQGGVCWLPAIEWRTQLVKFAQRYLGLNPPPYLDGDLPGQVAYCWQHWAVGNVLLVLDDVTDYSLLVKEDLPADSRFKVLMTTRETLDTPVVPLNLDVLEPDDALKLLKALVKKRPERFEEEPIFATRLCEWLEYLPLGVELVGRYLHLEPDLSLSVMLFQLQQQALKHESMERDEVDLQKAMTAERGVKAAFELSWKQLDDKSQHLGKLLSTFALAPIPWEYVELTEKYYCNLFNQGKGFSLEALKKAKRKLVYFHLLKHIDQEIYLLHSLIRKFFQSKREE